MSIRRRIEKVEREVNRKKGLIPPEDCVHVVCPGDQNVDQQIDEIEKRYLEKYGTLKGLTIIRIDIPDPPPLPDILRAPEE